MSWGGGDLARHVGSAVCLSGRFASASLKRWEPDHDCFTRPVNAAPPKRLRRDMPVAGWLWCEHGQQARRSCSPLCSGGSLGCVARLPPVVLSPLMRTARSCPSAPASWTRAERLFCASQTPAVQSPHRDDSESKRSRSPIAAGPSFSFPCEHKHSHECLCAQPTQLRAGEPPPQAP